LPAGLGALVVLAAAEEKAAAMVALAAVAVAAREGTEDSVALVAGGEAMRAKVVPLASHGKSKSP